MRPTGERKEVGLGNEPKSNKLIFTKLLKCKWVSDRSNNFTAAASLCYLATRQRLISWENMYSKLTKINSQLKSICLEKQMDAARELENFCSSTTVPYCAHWYFAQNLSLHRSTFNLSIFKSSTRFWLSYFIIFLLCLIWIWGNKNNLALRPGLKITNVLFSHFSLFFFNGKMLWFCLVWGFLVFFGGRGRWEGV